MLRVSLPNSRLAIKLFFFPIHFEDLFTKNFKPFKLFCDFTRLVCCFWLLWQICYASQIPPGPQVLPLNLLHGGQEREREMAARFFPSLGILVEDIGYRDISSVVWCFLKHHNLCFFDVQPYLGNWSKLVTMRLGWNHQLHQFCRNIWYFA